jgi:hypothetical protein
VKRSCYPRSVTLAARAVAVVAVSLPRMSDYKDARFAYSSEREALEGFLDYQREGLLLTLEGLDDAAARTAPSASSLSLLGLIKHAATWERRWFQVIMAGRELPENWPAVKTEPHDADMQVNESDTVDYWVGYYREQIEESRAIVASMDLDSPARGKTSSSATCATSCST